MPSDIKNRLVELRKKHKLTQEELGEKMGVDRSQISLIEGGYRYPSYEHMKRLADFFDVSVDYLMGRVDYPHADVKEVVDIKRQLEEGKLVYGSHMLSEREKKRLLIALQLVLDETPMNNEKK